MDIGLSNFARTFTIFIVVNIMIFGASAYVGGAPGGHRLLVRAKSPTEIMPDAVVSIEDLALVEEIKANNVAAGYGQRNLADRAERAKQIITAEEQLAIKLAERLSESVEIPQEAVTDIPASAGVGDYTFSDISEYEELVAVMYDWLGVKYVWGGTSKSGADCSGFVQKVYAAIGYELPRVSRDQSKYGTLVDRKNLMLGDLLFFDTRNPRDHNDIKIPSEEMQYAKSVELGEAPNVVSHVGVYIGDGVMVHASSGDGYITFADLESNYYKTRFINARRILGKL